MPTTSQTRSLIAERQGIALIAAVGMLFIFVALGTAYVRYMSLELNATRYELNQKRARGLAESGIDAAIGEIQAALAAKESPATSYTIDLNIYRLQGGERTAYPQVVSVAVFDEAARININHAKPAVLRALGLKGPAIQKLQQALPRGPQANDNARWLTSVDELRTRSILNEEEFAALNTDILTTYTAENPERPERFINLNGASPDALAIIFAIDPQEARALAQKRPFTSWRDAVTKSGREPSSFNIKSAQYAAREMPAELAMTSRSFRLRSHVSFQLTQSRPSIGAAVEAVVLFDRNGGYTIRFWNEKADRGPVEAAPADGEETTQQANIDRNGTEVQTGD